MTERAWNFSPGPGALPLPVLEEVRDDIVELRRRRGSIHNAMPAEGVRAPPTLMERFRAARSP